MKLLEVIQACHGRVSGGDPYLWDCYGENAQYMEFKDVNGKGYAHCVFDTKTYEVYEIHVEIPGQDVAFRWVNPLKEHALFHESKARGIDSSYAWDDVKYINIAPSNEERILDHLDDIGEGHYDSITKG